jgi:hypothetical protein
MRSHLLTWLFTASTVLVAGCESDKPQTTPYVAPEDNIGVREEPTFGDQEHDTPPPLEAGEREVQLRVNGELVRVVRPSATNPFVVAGGEFNAGDLDPATGPGVSGPVIGSTRDRPIDVIRRVPQTVTISVTDPDGVGDVLGYYVEFEGYDGYFFVPSEPDSEVYGAQFQQSGRFTLGFFMDEVFPPGSRNDQWAQGYGREFDVRMTIRATDRDHWISEPVVQMLHILPVGRGDLEVTLSMSLATDLDLYVVEPNGNTIYYANSSSFTTGRLDLDANAACASNMNVRYEHIFWPEGSVPEGTYHVRVDNWRNCVGGQPVDFQVIVQNCGDISVYEGTAQGSGGGGDCRNPRTASCQTIATVEVEECEDP